MSEFIKIKQLISQLVVFEDSNAVSSYCERFRKSWPKLSESEKKQTMLYIVELKLNQKLENGPMALFSLIEKSKERDNHLFNLINSEFNFAALIKWICVNKTEFMWNDGVTVKVLKEIVSGIDFDHFEKLAGFTGQFTEDWNYIQHKSSQLSSSRGKLALVTTEEGFEMITAEDILANFKDYIGIFGEKKVLSNLKQAALEGDYLLPMDWFLALYDHPTEAADIIITELFKKQFGVMRKLPGNNKSKIDGSGSMSERVFIEKGNSRYTPTRWDIAVWFTYQMGIMSNNFSVNLCVSNDKEFLIPKIEWDPNDTILSFQRKFQKLLEHYQNKGGWYSGIYTAESLRALEKTGEKVDNLFIFTDSGDMTSSNKKWPAIPPIRPATKIYACNVENDYGNSHNVESNAQFDMLINGYSNYMLEGVFHDLGFANPLFKATEFTGSGYRISF